MSITYTPTTNFGAKDSLPANDPAKVIKGAEFTTEYTAIQSAFALAAPAASPTFTGTATFDDVTVTNGLTVDGTTLVVDDTNNRVGIGESAPPSLLSVGDSSSVLFALMSNEVASFCSDADNSSGETAITIGNQASTTASVVELVSGNGGVADPYFAIRNRRSGGGLPAEALRIDDNGNVGIANTDPTGIGNASIDDLVIGDFSTARGVTIATGGATTGALSFADSGSSFAGLVEYNHASDYMRFFTGSAEKMRIDSSGNVGIGESSPSNPLHIQTTNTQTVRLENQSAAGNGDATVGLLAAKVGAGRHLMEYDAYRHVFKSGSAGAEAMRIDSSGNVGIGTSSPKTALDIVNNSAARIYLGTDASNFGGLVYSGGVMSMRGVGQGTAAVVSADAANSKVTFTTAGVADRMVIDSSGNVGIGTSSPGTRLVVQHNTNGSSGIEVRNDTAGTGSRSKVEMMSDSGTNLLGIYACSASYTGVSGWEDAGVISTSSAASKGLVLNANAVSDGIKFQISTNEKMRLDSSGNLLIGTPTLRNSSVMDVYRASGSCNAYVESDSLGNGQGVNWSALSGGRVGGVGVFKHSGITNPAPYANLGRTDGQSVYYWTDTASVLRTSTTSSNIGTTTGTVVGSQTSDERVKDIEPTFEYGLDAVMALNPIAYTLKDDADQTRKLGFGAQTTQAIVPEAVYDTGECLDGYEQDPDDTMVQTAKSSETRLAMEYVQLVPVLVKAIQELKAEVEALKNA